MYILGESEDEVRARGNILFEEYVKKEYFWLDFDDPEDQEYINEKKDEFMLGVSKVEWLPNGVAVDSHY